MHSDLIARLEAATGPDRELDAAIDMVRLNLRGTPATPVYFDGYDKGNWRDTVGLLHTGPAYTASIDTALTLLPEHKNLTLNIGPFPTHVARLDCPAGSFTAVAPTPALAICIAALRAGEG